MFRCRPRSVSTQLIGWDFGNDRLRFPSARARGDHPFSSSVPLLELAAAWLERSEIAGREEPAAAHTLRSS